MKIFYLICLLCCASMIAGSQTTYYWVGGAPAAPANISLGNNWNTALDGTGSTRSSSTGASDILVFDGTNIGGTTPTTGVDTVNVNSGITCAQIKLINNAAIFFIRSATGTSTMTINGEAGEDFVVESGASLSITSTVGSIVIAMAATNTGRVSGAFSMITPLQARIANGTTGTPGSFIFTSGATFTTNITAASAAYPFGNNTQSSERWVQFQSGSTLIYNGGFSPMGSSATFMPVDFAPGSNFVMRASNPVGSGGSFFNRKSYANITIDNGATLTSDGTIYRIENLTVNSGSTFVTNAFGYTTVLGNIVANGNLNSPAAGLNTLTLAGSSQQTISGSGTIDVPFLTVADNADVVLNRNITISRVAFVYGKLNFTTAQLQGAASFAARTNTTFPLVAGTVTAGSYIITGVAGAAPTTIGFTLSGSGIQPNTAVVSFAGINSDTIYLSKPAISSAANVPLGFTVTNTTLSTANPNGFDPVSGSVAVVDAKTYQPGINYIINGATAKPFGISTGAITNVITAGTVIINAATTTNATAEITTSLQLNNKITVRTGDTLRITSGATMPGSFDATKYVVTDANITTGTQGVFRYDNVSSAKILPVGTAAYYIPVTVTPTTASDFTAAVFQGITTNGTPNGTPFTAAQKQTVADAVWNVNRVAGTGSASLQLQWNAALEGTAFSTFSNADIGIITNAGGNWSLPLGPGNNTTNTASASVTSFGAFGIGAQPPAQPFIFNPLPAKTYGNPDFSAGVISSNTSTPVNYTSSNTAIATIVAGNIHIVGTGTTNITAAQASDGFYPAANVTQPLVVNKASLVINADDKTKPEGDPNPPITATYTGFVYGETATVLTTQVTISTTATLASPAGTYPITVSGATAVNYNISFVNGVMTVTPRQAQTITFAALPAKTYGNADFATGATSTNTTIPITYTSSNTAVATIVGNNIHIVSAGITTITASQAGNAFYFAAPNVSQTLTISKANLTVRAADTTRPFGVANPPFRLIYTGFVLGENAPNLPTQPTANTIATTTSSPGYYIIKVDGGVSANYNFVYNDGRLTILPETGVNESNLQVYKSSSSTLAVKIYSVTPALATVNVYDFNGRLRISNGTNFLPVGFITILLPADKLSSGIYFVKVTDSNGIELMKKISIMR